MPGTQPIRLSLPDVAAVESLGAQIADVLRPGDVIALSGGLGAGKTTLARAILLALGYHAEVPSPSFTIVEIYDPPLVRLPVVHADFYRLNNAQEAQELGLEDYRHGRALLAEWPEHIGGFNQEEGCLAISLDFQLENEGDGRVAIVERGTAWLGRFA